MKKYVRALHIPNFRKFNRKIHTLRDCPNPNKLGDEVYELESINGLQRVRAERLSDSDLGEHLSRKQKELVDKSFSKIEDKKKK